MTLTPSETPAAEQRSVKPISVETVLRSRAGERAGECAQASSGEPLKSVVRGALHLLSAQPLTWATSFLNLVFLPHLLGSRALGEWTFAFGITSFFGLIISLGFPSFLVRHVAADPAHGSRDAAATLVLQGCVATIAALGLSLAISRLHLPVTPIVLYIMLAGAVVASVRAVFSSFLTGRERIASVAWLGAGFMVTADCLGLAVLAMGHGLTLFVASGFLISLPMLVVVWRVSGLKIGREAINLGLWRRLLLGGLPFLGWNLALQVYGEIDKIMLGLLVPVAAVGWYGAAYAIIGIPVFIPSMIVTPLLPALSRLQQEERTFRDTLRRSFIAAFVLTVPIAAITIGVAPSLPALLHWPDDFTHSVPLMMILALQMPVVAIDMVLATGLFALKRERAWLCVGIVASVFNPGLNLLLIPIFQRWLQNGAIGASIVTVATELVMLAGALVLLPAGILGRGAAWLSARTVLSGLGSFLVTASLRPICLPLAPAAGGGVFLGLCLALGVVRVADLRSLDDTARQLYSRRLARSGR